MLHRQIAATDIWTEIHDTDGSHAHVSLKQIVIDIIETGCMYSESLSWDRRSEWRHYAFVIVLTVRFIVRDNYIVELFTQDEPFQVYLKRHYYPTSIVFQTFERNQVKSRSRFVFSRVASHARRWHPHYVCWKTSSYGNRCEVPRFEMRHVYNFICVHAIQKIIWFKSVDCLFRTLTVYTCCGNTKQFK